MSRSPLDRALALRSRLRDDPRILVVPGAWDVSSARIFAALGAELIAIPCAALATTLGKPRLDATDESHYLTIVERIVERVSIPVCVDLGNGWGADPETLARRIERVLATGAAAVQLSDASDEARRPLLDPSLQVERIQAIREHADRFGHPLNLHAWTHALDGATGDDRSLEAVTRSVRYATAGASTIGTSGVADRATARRLLVDLPVPLGVSVDPSVAHPAPPTSEELEDWGVKRIDLGASTLHATLGLVRRAGAELISRGSFEHLRGEFRLGDARKALDSAES